MTMKIGTGGEHTGDVCWPEIEVGTHRVLRATLRDGLESEGLKALAGDVEDPSDQASFGKALADVKRDTEAAGVTVEREEKGSRIALVRVSEGEGVSKTTETWARCQVGASGIEVEWNASLVGTGHASESKVREVIDVLRARFDMHHLYLTHTEVGALTVEVITGWCGGVRLRRNGGVYFVPADGADLLRRYSSALERFVGNSRIVTVPTFDHAETRANVGAQVSDALMHEIKAVLDGVKTLKTRRESVGNARLEALNELRNRAAACELVMEAYRDDLEAAIKSAEQEILAVFFEDDDEDEAAE